MQVSMTRTIWLHHVQVATVRRTRLMIVTQACLRTKMNHLSRKSHPPRKRDWMNKERTAIPWLLSWPKPYSSPNMLLPLPMGNLHHLWIKLWGRKLMKTKKMELKKHENCHLIRDKGQSRCLEQFRWVSSVNWLKILKVQKSLIKRIVVVVSEVNKLMGTSEIQKEDTVSVLMDGVLLLANANQDLKCWQRES